MSTGVVQRRKYNTEEPTEEGQEERDESSLLTLMEEILLLGLKDSEVEVLNIGTTFFLER
jgi:hypothetical protein